jgi:hypothetical protein
MAGDCDRISNGTEMEDCVSDLCSVTTTKILHAVGKLLDLMCPVIKHFNEIFIDAEIT